MERRKVCFLSTAFLLGIAAAEYQKTLLWCILGLYSIIWAYFIGKAYKRSVGTVFWLAVFLAAVVGGVCDSCSRKLFCNAYMPYLKEGQECLVQGKIYQKEKERENILFYLKNCRVQFDQKDYPCNQILLYLNAEQYSIGEILCVKGKINLFSSAANEGNYDEKKYFQSLKIDFKVIGEDVISIYGKKNMFQEGLLFLRENIKESYEAYMPKADAGVLTAMTLGDKSLMDKKRKTIYQNAGISHFYSISGLHISMIGMAVYYFLKKRSGSYLFSGAAAAVLMFGYGGLTGFSISASRAIGMFFLLLYAKCRGRSYDRPTALAFLAAILAGKNPNLLHHAGYLLSFGAVLGVIFAGWIRKNFFKEKESDAKKWAAGVKETFFVSLFIQLVTIPVLCQFFYEISLYAVFANLVVLPCMGLLLALGIFGGIAGCFFPFAGKLILYPCNLILLLFDLVCQVILKLPSAVWVTGRLPDFCVFLWYGLLLLFVMIKKCRQNFSVLFLVVPFCILFFMPGNRVKEIDVLDVGQGDGIYISTGDGTSVFIDGGSSNINKVGNYRILPFLKYKGVRKMDYWFVSHCDADHISGLREIIESGYRIENLVVSSYMPQDKAWEELKGLARNNKISILKMSGGDRIKSRKDGWNIRCLSVKYSENGRDRNENSMVLLFESKNMTGFFGGDIGCEQEMKLIKAWNLQGVDVYKASHHGSDFSNSSELLQKLKPKMAVISCSIKNSYGHPGKKALLRMAESGCKIYETRFLGQVKIIEGNLEAKGYSVLESFYEDD